MSRSVDIYSYDYKQLVEGIKVFTGESKTDLIEIILGECGNKIGDRYVVLSNDYDEMYSPLTNVSLAFDDFYEVEDTFGEIFITLDRKFDRESLINYADTVDDMLETIQDERHDDDE